MLNCKLRQLKSNDVVYLDGVPSIETSYRVVGWVAARPENVVLEATDGKRIVRHQDTEVKLCQEVLV
jgi:hypothetical protein